MTTAAHRYRLAAVAESPVFYQVPLYRALAADPRVDLTVIYGSSAGVRPYDALFGGRAVTWDVDLLGGYESVFLPGADKAEVTKGFMGLRQPAVFRTIARGRFDCVWVHGYSYAILWLAMAAAAVSGAQILVREEQTLLHDRPWPKSWIRSGILRALFSQVSGLYIGSQNRAYFEKYGVSPERLFFAPYCVDNDGLREAAARLAPRRVELRARLGVHDDRPIVLFVGKLRDKKQPLLLLEAYSRVRAEQRCALVFAGGGPLESEVRRRAESIVDVAFAGFLNRSEIATAYVAADVFVLPSRLNETWGLVVNEAMNFSLPIVVSDKVGSAADLVRPGENGFVFPAHDVEALASSLRTLVSDAALRKRFGARSFEIVSDFAYPRAAEGVIAACEAAKRGTR